MDGVRGVKGVGGASGADGSSVVNVASVPNLIFCVITVNIYNFIIASSSLLSIE